MRISNQEAQRAIMAGILGEDNFDVIWEAAINAPRMSYDPHTRRYRVFLPVTNMDDQTQVTHVRAYSDHEIGHAKRRSHDCATPTDPLEKDIYGMVEDVRINHTFGNNYLPGSWKNIITAHELQAQDMLKEGHSLKTKADTALYDAFLQCHTLPRRFASDTNDLTDPIFEKMSQIADPYVTVHDTMRVVKEIAKLIRDDEDAGNPDGDGDKGDPEPKEGGGHGRGKPKEGDGPPQDGTPQPGDGKKGKDKKKGEGQKGGTPKPDTEGKPDKPDKDGKKGDNQNEGDGASDGRGVGTGRPTQGAAEEAAKALADMVEKSMKGDKKLQSLKKKIENGRYDYGDDCMKAQERLLTIPGRTSRSKVLPPALASLRTHLARALRAHGSLDHDTKMGRLNRRKIATVAMGNTRVFTKADPERQVDTSVALLIDCSGSMHGHFQEMAAQVTAAVGTACRDVGAKTSLISFGSIWNIVWDFDDKLTADSIIDMAYRGAYANGGGTIIADPLKYITRRIKQQRTERKLVVAVTDGDVTRHCYQTAKKLVTDNRHIQYSSIGIGSYSTAVFCRNTHVQVGSMAQFGAAVFKKLAEVMGIAARKVVGA